MGDRSASQGPTEALRDWLKARNPNSCAMVDRVAGSVIGGGRPKVKASRCT